MKWTRRAVVAGILGLVAAPSAGGADPGAGPAARLVVTGRIAEPGGRREFSRAEVEALGLSSFETRTPWYSGAMRFEGVPLRVLLEKLGASGDRLLALARDGYKGEIPLADLGDPAQRRASDPRQGPVLDRLSLRLRPRAQVPDLLQALDLAGGPADRGVRPPERMQAEPFSLRSKVGEKHGSKSGPSGPGTSRDFPCPSS